VRRLAKLALGVAAGLLVVILALEVTSREVTRRLARQRTGLRPDFLEPDLRREYTLRPSASIDYAGITTQLDPLGLRGRFPDMSSVGVIALGDEITFGWGVADQDTYPAQLHEILAGMEAEQPEVLNAGVPGYTSYQGLILLKQLLHQFHPRVVVASFHLNDAVYVRPETALDLTSQLAPISLQTWVPRWKDSVLYLWKSAFPPAVRWEHSHPRLSVNHYQASIEAVLTETRRRGAEIILLNVGFAPQLGPTEPQPRRYRRGWLEDDYNEAIRDVAAKFGAPLVEMSGTALTQATMLDDLHPSPAGYRLIAERIVEAMRDRALMRLAPGKPSAPEEPSVGTRP
jgi:lysophospholipase L1-like esterase